MEKVARIASETLAETRQARRPSRRHKAIPTATLVECISKCKEVIAAESTACNNDDEDQRLTAFDVDAKNSQVYDQNHGRLPGMVDMGCVDIIFFDWDDTLLPTWFITDVVYPNAPECKNDAIPESNTFYELLAEHAKTVESLLVRAAALGQVVIVTLARRDWVLTSAERYLPGVNWKDFLEKLRIPVIYAREHLYRKHATFAQEEDGVNLFVLAKRNAMAKFMRRKRRKARGSRLNVLSVGDSIIEREALREVMWSFEGYQFEPICKTVKLMDEPPVRHLSSQLTLITSWIQRLTEHDDDFDISLDDSEDFDKISEVFKVL